MDLCHGQCFDSGEACSIGIYLVYLVWTGVQIRAPYQGPMVEIVEVSFLRFAGGLCHLRQPWHSVAVSTSQDREVLHVKKTLANTGCASAGRIRQDPSPRQSLNKRMKG